MTAKADRRRHVVVVGINYAPEQSGIAPYTTALAEYLAADGHQVTAVTGMPHYPSWRVERPYRHRLWRDEQRNGVRVLRQGHYVPRHQSALSRGLYEGSFLVTAASSLLRVRRPDAIVGVVPSLSGAVVARLLALRFRAPYGVIFQDLMANSAIQSGIAGGGNVAGLARWVEGAVARSATAVGAVSEGFFPYLQEAGVPPERLVYVPNWAHIHEPGPDRWGTRRRLGWGDDEIVVLHAGNMGLKQGLEQVIAAAQLARERALRVRFAFIGDGNQRRRLQEEARRLPNVTFYGFEPEETFADALGAADILLVSERATAVDMSLPSKLTSYFLSGRPVLAAVCPNGTTAREIARSGAGVDVPAGDPARLLDAIGRLSADPVWAASLASAGRSYARVTLESNGALARAAGFVERLVGEVDRDR